MGPMRCEWTWLCSASVILASNSHVAIAYGCSATRFLSEARTGSSGHQAAGAREMTGRKFVTAFTMGMLLLLGVVGYAVQQWMSTAPNLPPRHASSTVVTPLAPVVSETTLANIDGLNSGTGQTEGFSELDLLKVQSEAKRDARIAGIIVDKSGRPLSGMHVANAIEISTTFEPGSIMQFPKVAKGFGTSVPKVETRDDGTFLLDGLAPGEYGLIALPVASGRSGAHSATQTIHLKESQALTGIRLIYEGVGAHTIAGRVANTQGAPIADASVAVVDYMTSSSRFQSFTTTNANGDFVLEIGRDRPCDITITHAEYTRQLLGRVEQGTNNLNIILEGRGAISGQVLDRITGEPIPRFEARSIVGSGLAEHLGFTTFEDAEGRFTLDSVASGEDALFIRAAGYAPMRLTIPTVREGEVVAGIVVRLDAGASLEAEVVDMNGTPIPDVKISLGRDLDYSLYPPALGNNQGEDEFHATSDARGRFTLDLLNPATSEATLVHPDHQRTVVPLSLVLGEKTVLTMVMTGFATLEGVVSVNGEPMEGASVSVEHDSLVSPLYAETDVQGRYLVKEVPEGEVVVHASYGSRVQTITATTALGHTTVVDVEIAYGTATFEGKVTMNGWPLAHVSLAASSVGGDDSGSATVTEEGIYRISGLLGGEYQIYVLDVRSQEPILLGSARGTVAAGETVVMDIECGE